MLFLDDADYVKLRALAHGGTARRCSIELFLAKVFGREAEYEAQQDAAAEADGKKRCKQPKLDPSRHRWGGTDEGRGEAAEEAEGAVRACWHVGCNLCWLWHLLSSWCMTHYMLAVELAVTAVCCAVLQPLRQAAPVRSWPAVALRTSMSSPITPTRWLTEALHVLSLAAAAAAGRCPCVLLLPSWTLARR
jgi:hypothetical protein